MQQSKLDSLIEALLSTFIGFIVSFTANLILMPMLGIPVSLSQNFILTVAFTFVSVARSYLVRRFANKYLSQVRAKMVEFFRKEVK
mgnify:FL=1